MLCRNTRCILRAWCGPRSPRRPAAAGTDQNSELVASDRGRLWHGRVRFAMTSPPLCCVLGLYTPCATSSAATHPAGRPLDPRDPHPRPAGRPSAWAQADAYQRVCLCYVHVLLPDGYTYARRTAGWPAWSSVAEMHSSSRVSSTACTLPWSMFFTWTYTHSMHGSASALCAANCAWTGQKNRSRDAWLQDVIM